MGFVLSLLVARVKFEAWVKFESRVRFESGPKFFFLVFFFDNTNEVRAVTRNVNFPGVDIFHSRSKEPLPLRIAVASPRYTTIFNINTFSKNTKVYNLHIAEEHVPYTWYTRKTDGEGSRSQEYLSLVSIWSSGSSGSSQSSQKNDQTIRTIIWKRCPDDRKRPGRLRRPRSLG